MQDVTRTGALVTVIRSKVASGALAPDEKLPSIRRSAATYGVSPTTVVEAYGRLAADGLIRSRPGSGFYVARPAPSSSLAEVRPQGGRDIDPLWVSRLSLDVGPTALQPGCGWLPADWLPAPLLRRGLRNLARLDDAMLGGYGATRGSVDLRRWLVRQLAQEDIVVGLDQVLLTGSAAEALDLVCRRLLVPGDKVLLEDPCYFNFQALLQALGAQVLAVPMTPAGPNPEAFEAIVAAHRPRLYITNSGLHNPTGATLTPQIAQRIIGAANAHDLTIVEDDIFADLEPERAVRLASLDGLRQVIRIGSFSKTISGAVRCGYIVGSSPAVEALVDFQVATRFGGPSPVATTLIASVLRDAAYPKHLIALRQRLATARRSATSTLAALGITPWLVPRGGFYLWCRLPANLDAGAVARAALRRDLVLAPGDVFSPTRSATNFMRFNVAHLGPMAVSRLAEAISEARHSSPPA